MIVGRVLFYVQHLQGVGHVHRAAHVANALAGSGLDVLLVSGGMPVPGLSLAGPTLCQLPPMVARAGNFKDLVTDAGLPIDLSWKATRRDELVRLAMDFQPNVAVTEAFPFGRHQLRFELLPLLEAMTAMTPRPVVVASVRDILQEGRKQERITETLETLNRFFDRVLVHGDPAFARLDETFPRVDEIACTIHYSGLVSGPPPSADDGLARAQREVLVSTGGGATRGERLLSAALDARPLTSVRDLTWRFLLGPNLPGVEAERLRRRSEKGVIIENNRSDFGELLAGCALSVSQAGYNTVCDILRASCRSVLIPYADLGETEQTFRAARMHEAGLAQMVNEDDLSPVALAAAIDAAMIAKSGNATLDLDGAAQSARLIMNWLAAA